MTITTPDATQDVMRFATFAPIALGAPATYHPDSRLSGAFDARATTGRNDRSVCARDSFFSRSYLRVLGLIFALGAMVANGIAAEVVVDAKANIFGAGHSIPPAPAGNGAGILPPSIAIIPGQSVIFPSITGTVTYSDGTLSAPAAPFGPEGSTSFGTTISAFGGISAISGSGFLWLVGVFLDDAEPTDPAPSALATFSAAAKQFTSIAPSLRQIFFIGDGQQAGVPQVFKAPSNATRLFLGFADGGGGSGQPGYYADNVGSLSVTPCLSAPLTIQAAGTNVVLSWPQSVCNFVLQRSDELGVGADWGPEGSVPVVIGNDYVVTNSVTGISRFYRLQIQ